jgi:hypothetical protein
LPILEDYCKSESEPEEAPVITPARQSDLNDNEGNDTTSENEHTAYSPVQNTLAHLQHAHPNDLLRSIYWESTECCKLFGYLGEDEVAYVGLEERIQKLERATKRGSI